MAKKIEIKKEKKSKSKIFIIIFLILSLIGNGVLGYYTYNFYNKNKKMKIKNEEYRTKVNIAINDLYDITGLKTKYYIKNKLNFFDENIVFQIQGYGNYYYSYDCMMQKVGNNRFSYAVYHVPGAQSQGLREGSC